MRWTLPLLRLRPAPPSPLRVASARPLRSPLNLPAPTHRAPPPDMRALASQTREHNKHNTTKHTTTNHLLSFERANLRALGGATGNHATSGLKFRVLLPFLKVGANVLLSDVDVAYLRDPLQVRAPPSFNSLSAACPRPPLLLCANLKITAACSLHELSTAPSPAPSLRAAVARRLPAPRRGRRGHDRRLGRRNRLRLAHATPPAEKKTVGRRGSAERAGARHVALRRAQLGAGARARVRGSEWVRV